jgi:predicted permease
MLVVVTLAVGIGANATMAGVIDRLVMQPPPQVREPHRIVRLLFSASGNSRAGAIGSTVSYTAMFALRHVEAFESQAGYSSANLSLGLGPDATEIRATLVTPLYFEVFGANAAAGRFFGAHDGYPIGGAEGGEPLVVLSHGFWKREFAGDPAVLGRLIRLGHLTYTIVGVATQGFRGVETVAPDLWLPISVTAPAEMPALWFAGDGATWVTPIARLRPGVSRDVAEEQATVVWRHGNAIATVPDSTSRILAASIIRGRGPDAPREVRVAIWLGGVAAMVLLIACANVSSLLLARAFARRREMAVRVALGASRPRLAAQMLLEALVLVACASVAAGLLGSAAARILTHFIDVDTGASNAMSFVNPAVLVYTGTVGLLSVVLVSLVPLLQFSSPNASDALRIGSGGGGGQTSRFRAVLLSLQAGLCMVLLVGAGLFAMSLYRISRLDLGFDRDRTVMVRFNLDFLADADPTYSEMVSRVRAIPGVERVAFAEINPYRNGRAVAAHTSEHDADYFWPIGVPEIPMEAAVDSGFFRTVGANIRGRDFSASDHAGAQRVAIINEPLARVLWPNAEALGQCVILPVRADYTGRACSRVVGVVSGFWRRTILNRDQLLVYVPLAQRKVVFSSPRAMFVRVATNPAMVLEPIRTAVQSLRIDLPAVTVSLLREAVEPEIRPWRAAAFVFGAFGLAALIIAAVGLYGVVAFTAAQRAPEIAVRVALGARRFHVLGVVAGQGLSAVTVGLVIGVVVALLSRRFVKSLVFETSPTDPAIFGAVALFLLLASCLAVVVPTVRVLRKNPAAVLYVE